MSRSASAVAALAAALPLLAACGGSYYPDTDLFGANLEVQSLRMEFQRPGFRDEVRETLRTAAAAAGQSTEAYRGWTVVVQDGGVECNGTRYAPGGAHWWNGCVSSARRTISVSVDDAPDIQHSQLMHELFHVFLSGDGGHSHEVWRDCQMWVSLWMWANERSGRVPYNGMWVGAGYQGREFCSAEVEEHRI